MAQSAPPTGEKGDSVIAIFKDDGGKLTLDEFNTLVELHPSWQGRPREEVIHKYAVLRRFAHMAKADQLDEKAPYKEHLKAILDFDLLYYMADFLVQEKSNAITIDPAEIEKYYNDHKEIYKQVTVSGIRIAVGSGAAADTAPSNASKPVKKALTEPEAKAKAEKLVADLRAGADFCKVALLESDDETSKKKCGAMGAWKMTDNVPDLMRSTVLSLKEGAISDPVLQNGPTYYIFRADSVTYSPLKEVEDSVHEAVKQQKFQDWLQTLDKSTEVQITAKEPLPPPAMPSDQKK